MTLHGHEIPEEFVREVQEFILRHAGEFSQANICAHYATACGTAAGVKHSLGLGYYGWDDLLRMILVRIFNRLRRAGKIEYLGRSQGWRVKR